MLQSRSTSISQPKSDDGLSKTFKHSQLKHIAKTYQQCDKNLTQYTLRLTQTVPVSPQTLKEQLLELIKNQPSPAFGELFKLMNGWLIQKWKELRAGISSRLAKLNYLLPSLLGETYCQTEKEILYEWKKNAMLHGLQFLWNHVFMSWNFENLQEIKQFYNSMRSIIAQISYLLFEESLKILLKQNTPVESRLYNFTAVEIITRYKDWPNIYEKVIKPSYQIDRVSFSQNYSLTRLRARPEILDINTKTPLFPETAKSLIKLVSSCSKQDIVNSLKEYRTNLLKQIELNIERYSKRKNSKNQVTVEKQDILSSIIYILVRYRIEDIAQTLSYLSFLWNSEMQSVLGVHQVDSYRVDLEVAYEYLCQPFTPTMTPTLKMKANFT